MFIGLYIIVSIVRKRIILYILAPVSLKSVCAVPRTAAGRYYTFYYGDDNTSHRYQVDTIVYRYTYQPDDWKTIHVIFGTCWLNCYFKGTWEDATPSNGQSNSLLQKRHTSLTWPRSDGDVLIAGVYTVTSELVYDGTTTYTWPNVTA